jgi:hypothetical protein
MIYLIKKKRFVEKYLYWVAHEEIHGFANDSNSYRSMMMNAMRMNQDYSSEVLCNIPLNEEPNINAIRFFKLLKDFDEPL